MEQVVNSLTPAARAEFMDRLNLYVSDRNAFVQQFQSYNSNYIIGCDPAVETNDSVITTYYNKQVLFKSKVAPGNWANIPNSYLSPYNNKKGRRSGGIKIPMILDYQEPLTLEQLHTACKDKRAVVVKGWNMMSASFLCCMQFHIVAKLVSEKRVFLFIPKSERRVPFTKETR